MHPPPSAAAMDFSQNSLFGYMEDLQELTIIERPVRRSLKVRPGERTCPQGVRPPAPRGPALISAPPHHPPLLRAAGTLSVGPAPPSSSSPRCRAALSQLLPVPSSARTQSSLVWTPIPKGRVPAPAPTWRQPRGPCRF